jgi:hypothetical protein
MADLQANERARHDPAEAQKSLATFLGSFLTVSS